ncbi:MAG: nicotinate-nucleotide adenylyltransferase [Thiomonas sp.]
MRPLNAAARHVPRIGLLGGSFDPIHSAHLQLAQSACTELVLDAVWFIPAGQPWQRDPLAASPQQRWDMVNLAIAGVPCLRACDIELKRDGPSYTIDTVRELRAAHPGTAFTFILGADQLRNLPTWNGWEDIVALVDLAAARRLGYDDVAPPELLTALAAHGHRLHRLAMAEIDLSATRVRNSIAHGQPLAGLVPAAVAHYIDQHRLYQH